MGKEKRAEKESTERRLYAGLALLVSGLVALVWWSLPGDRPNVIASADADSHEPNDAPGDAGLRRRLERPPRAAAELAIVTDKPEDVVRAAATATAIGKRLDVRHCGGACDAVRKFISDEDAFELDVLKTEDLILPPKDTLDTVAAGLTPAQRESVHGRPHSVVIRTQGNVAPEQLPARTAFAVAALLAEQLDGFVYDEVSRRIETVDEVLAHTVTAKLGEPAFVRKHIVVQLYRQDDGTARLLTLGMARFGSPDLSIRGANMASGPLLAEVINAAASQIAHGKSDAEITITLEDVARVVGKKPAELHTNPGAARPVVFQIVEPERIEGDPDNEMAELLPPGVDEAGGAREAWDRVVTSLFGITPSVRAPVGDKELADVAKRAQRDLPSAIRRFEAGEGTLYLKAPFAIPEEARTDGGASTELLWVEAASCNPSQCTGVLSNDPTYATNIALGKTTSVKRAEVVDWVIHQRDGGMAGGESIKALRSRAVK